MRFSKKSFREQLEQAAQDIEKKHGFHSQYGYSQVEGKAVEVVYDYGRYDMLLNLVEELYF
jgi:hypothetical protein